MKILLRTLSLVCALGGAGLLIYHFTQPTERYRTTSDSAKPGKLEWDPPTVRKTLMTFAYKVFGNKDVETGRFFTARTVLKNRGEGPVKDISVSYQIPDYLDWSTPTTWPDLPPGQSVISTYYPQLPAKVAQLANETTATVEIKIKWSDASGRTKEEVLSNKFELRGVNEIEYSDLPADDVLTWHDLFNCAPFVVSMVTPNDPVVKEYASQISTESGGSLAGVLHTRESIVELMTATYNHMLATGMQYSGAKGVPADIGNVKTTVQTIRLPRDVILNNTGLCIELAILWASVLEHLGVETSVALIPGHAFIVAHPRTPEGQYDAPLPIECTAITPKAVGAQQTIDFNGAVEMAVKEYNDAREKNTLINLNIRDYQKAGFVPPELPQIDLDKIKTTLAMREKKAQRVAEVENDPAPAPRKNGQNEDAGTGGAWIHPDKLMAIPLPEGWAEIESGNVEGQVYMAHQKQAGVFVEAYHYENATSTQAGLKTLIRSIRANGVELEISDQNDDNGKLIFGGTYQVKAGEGILMGVFAQTRGGACAVLVDGLKENFAKNKDYLVQFLEGVEFSEKK